MDLPLCGKHEGSACTLLLDGSHLENFACAASGCPLAEPTAADWVKCAVCGFTFHHRCLRSLLSLPNSVIPGSLLSSCFNCHPYTQYVSTRLSLLSPSLKEKLVNFDLPELQPLPQQQQQHQQPQNQSTPHQTHSPNLSSDSRSELQAATAAILSDLLS